MNFFCEQDRTKGSNKPRHSSDTSVGTLGRRGVQQSWGRGATPQTPCQKPQMLSDAILTIWVGGSKASVKFQKEVPNRRMSGQIQRWPMSSFKGPEDSPREFGSGPATF